MRIKAKRLSDTAVMPVKGSEGAAGFDLFADLDEPKAIYPGSMVMMQTNIAFEIPKGWFGAVFARSGLSTKKGIRPANCVGVIDSDYRGSVGVPLYNDSRSIYFVHPGERVSQIVFLPAEDVWLDEVDDLEDTKRGEGGFGSTGKS